MDDKITIIEGPPPTFDPEDRFRVEKAPAWLIWPSPVAD
jgi:hypothetical protein